MLHLSDGKNKTHKVECDHSLRSRLCCALIQARPNKAGFSLALRSRPTRPLAFAGDTPATPTLRRQQRRIASLIACYATRPTRPLTPRSRPTRPLAYAGDTPATPTLAPDTVARLRGGFPRNPHATQATTPHSVVYCLLRYAGAPLPPHPRGHAGRGFRFGCLRVLALLALRNDATRACRV